MIHYLMPKQPWEHQSSRDYNLPTIPCKVNVCPANASGKCEMPSAISINAEGMCELGKKAREKHGG